MNARILGTQETRLGEPGHQGAGHQEAGHQSKPGGTLVTKRFFALDGKTYEDGKLPAKTKELLGLVASMVLRCDDCIAYHINQCVAAGCSDEELWETFDVALVVGGSIVIPHMRRGVEFLDLAREHTTKK